ncbi:MAG: type II toxin-antitoxin system ParD family antitoxin [Caulobacteraceae bacterium]|nr:type II toxin-antitoxin system ParD family antitoxin [Caulobacteraceae bacterium]
MATRNISLTGQLDDYVEERVASGAYQNASQVVRAGLRALSRDQAEHAIKLERLKATIQVGVDELDRGEGLAVTDVSAWLEDLVSDDPSR